MSLPALRFVHSGDLHLERPPFGLAEVPVHLRDRLLDAPYRAAERLIDAVLREQADFLVLSGDVLHVATAGPRGLAFLAEQFERLAAAGVHVYWAGGRVDPPHLWPESVPLPDEVHRFPVGAPVEHVHRRDGTPVARINGRSSDRDTRIQAKQFLPHGDDVYSVAVSYGTAAPQALERPGVDYWALGGLHRRTTVVQRPLVAHYPGTPQGRRPNETGPHGATLVEVDADRIARLRPLSTDVLRWRREKAAVDEDTTMESLERTLADRLRAVRVEDPELDFLVSWRIVGTGPLATRLRRPAEAEEALAQLRNAFGAEPPVAWSVSLDVAPPPLPSAEEIAEHSDMLGDFLQLVCEQAEPDAEPSSLEELLTDAQQAGVVGDVVRLDDAAERRGVLRRSAALALDLMGGGK